MWYCLDLAKVFNRPRWQVISFWSKTGMIGLGMLPIFSKRIGVRGIGGLGEEGFFCSLSQRRWTFVYSWTFVGMTSPLCLHSGIGSTSCGTMALLRDGKYTPLSLFGHCLLLNYFLIPICSKCPYLSKWNSRKYV